MMQKITIGLILTLIIVIFIPLYLATEPERQEAARARQQNEAVGRGAELYSEYCAACHGYTGEGNIGPALKGTKIDESGLIKTTSRGVNGTPMPAMDVEEGGPLKSHQIEDTVTFILNWDQSLVETPPESTPEPSAASPSEPVTVPASGPEPVPATPATPEPSPTPTPTPTQPPAAPAINGSELYSVKCAGCHGTDRLGIPNLSPALTPESLASLSDEAIADVISNGVPDTVMMPFEDILSPEEIDALIQFIKYDITQE